MTKGHNEPRPVGPGDTLHVLAGGVLAFGNAWRRGDTIRLTGELVASTIDLNGNSWLDDVSENAQVARWGDVRFGVGPWPEGLHAWLPGTRDWAEARETARRAAHRLEDPEGKRQALAEVQRVFGDAPTSQTLNSAADPSVRIAQDQRDRLDSEGVRLRSSYTPPVREV